MRSFLLRSCGLIVAVVILGGLMFGSATALTVTISRGKTSQHAALRVSVVKPQLAVGQLIIELRTRCTDHKHRAIWPGFLPPWSHPQGSKSRISDSYDIVGRDIGTGIRFRQRASFTARLAGDTLNGSARVTQTFLATGVICKSPRVTFSVHL